MIIGRDIAQALVRLVPNGSSYDPDSQARAGKLPNTMRELVEGKFDIQPDSPGPEFTWGEMPKTKQRMPGRLISVQDIPVLSKNFPRRKRLVRPSGPPKVEDYQCFFPLLSAFWAWAKKKHIASQIDIDHPLSCDFKGRGWPILNRFADELNARGMYMEDIFPQNDWGCCGEEEPFDHAYLPLYCTNYDDSDVPLLELLERLHSTMRSECCYRFDTLPEAAYEFTDDKTQVDQAATVLLNIVGNRRRFALLPDIWANALEGLKEYRGGCLTFTEYEEVSIEILPGNHMSIQFLFECCQSVADVRKVIDPLVQKVMEDTAAFWQSFVETLNDIGNKNPKLTKEKETRRRKTTAAGKH